MTPGTLVAATGCAAPTAMRWAEPITATLQRFAINTPQRAAAFLAQIAHESSLFTALRESMNYSPQGLKAAFGNRLTADQCNALGRQLGEKVVPLDRQRRIANLVYGGRYGNAPTGDDGWNYRGGGLKQITFRANYRDVGKQIGVDLEGNPGLIEVPANAALSAGAFWSLHGLNSLADDGNFTQITRIINPALAGLDRREALWEKAKTALGV